MQCLGIVEEMKNRLQNPPANRPRLVRNRVTIAPFPPWINVAGLHSRLNLDAISEHPPNQSVDLSADRNSVHIRDDLCFFNHISDLPQRLELPAGGSAENPCMRIARNGGGYPAIRFR